MSDSLNLDNNALLFAENNLSTTSLGHNNMIESYSAKEMDDSTCNSLCSLDLGTSSSSCSNSPCCGSLLKISVRSTYTLMDEVIAKCGNPRLKLKENPPCIFHCLPDIYQKLHNIVLKYDENYEELSQIDYLPLFVRNLHKHCKSTLHLFEKADDDRYCESVVFRKQIVKFSLIFSNTLADLKAIFPDNVFVKDSYRITKPDAAQWWKVNFPGKVIVPWCLFSNIMLVQFNFADKSFLNALKKTIDFTCSNHVSIFEFDVFVRLFQPWNNILESWKALAVLHPGYIAYITYDEVEELLYPFQKNPGTFVYRQSCTQLGQWAIGYVAKNGEIQQTIIKDKPLAQALLDGQHNGCYLYPRGQSNCSDIIYELVHNLPQIHLQVSEEEYQTYCALGSTFEQCKICTDNQKDSRLDPCGHLLCKICLEHHLASSVDRHCPFCRSEIKDIVDIVLDPYQPDSLNDFDLSNKSATTSNATGKKQQLAHIYDRGHVNLASKFGTGSSEMICPVNFNNPFIKTSNFHNEKLINTIDLGENPKIIKRPAPFQLQTLTKNSNTVSKNLFNTNPMAQQQEMSCKTINYAELDFMHSDTSGEGVVSSSNGMPSSAESSQAKSHSQSLNKDAQRVLVAMLTVDFHERNVSVPSDTELSRIASVLLRSTNNNLEKAQKLLKYFQPRNHIAWSNISSVAD